MACTVEMIGPIHSVGAGRDAFPRVRRSTFTEGAIMERNTIGTRERAWQKRQRRVETCNAGRAGAHRPSEALHPTRSSDMLPRIARERVPTVPHVAKTRRNVPRRIARERVLERVPASRNGIGYSNRQTPGF